jgi:hypothetical protein
MKRTFWVIAVLGLSALAFGQAAAPQNQIDVGGGIYDTDPTGVYANFNTASSGQNAKYSPSANWNGKYTYTLPLDQANTLKLALADDGWYGFYSGTSGTASESGQNAGMVTPTAEYLGYGFDVTLSVPIYYYNPADAGGFNELKYAYKEAGYFTENTTNYPLNSSDSVITTINGKVFYKYSFDKTTWVQAGVAVLYEVSPTPWLSAFLPKVSVAGYGAQLDVGFDDYNAYADSSSNQYSDYYLEPKLTYDFGFANLVPGLKAYVSSRAALWTTNPAYNTTAVPNQPFHDTWVQPGVNYTLSVPQVGSFVLDAGWRFCKVDNVGTASTTDTGKYTGVSSNPKDVAPYDDLRIGITYTYKF